MKKETYKEYLEDQSDIRKKLFRVIHKNPKPLEQIAQEIGISKATIFRFLKSEKNVAFMQLHKIEQWIEKSDK